MPKRAIATAFLLAFLAVTPANAQAPADRTAELSRQVATLTERLRTLEDLFVRTNSGSSLSLRGIGQRAVVTAGAANDGNGVLRITDPEDHGAVSMLVDKDGGLLSLRSSKDQIVAQFFVDKDGTGTLSLGDSAGKTKVLQGVTQEGGLVQATHASGEIVAVLRALEHGGFLRLNDKSGKSAVQFGLDKSGSIYGEVGEVHISNDDDGGLLLINDRTGKRVVELGAAPGGDAHFVLNGRNARDYAEVFELKTRDGVVAGTVMAAATDGSGALEPSAVAYDARVVGVVGGAGPLRHAMLVGTRADGSRDAAVALAGQVYVRVVNENGAIAPGDLLVASPVAGVAMRATPDGPLAGRVLGKALGRFDGPGEGLVLMLVMAR